MSRKRGALIIASMAALLVATLPGCGESIYVGSDLWWTARHEGGDFTEWTTVPGGATEVSGTNAAVVSTARAHGGAFAAELTVTTSVPGVQQTATLIRAGDLPGEAYYGAWFFLPRQAQVGVFWVIMKFRQRAVAADPSTASELYDLDLRNLASGQMSLRLFDHRRGGDVPLAVEDPVIPIGSWFHLEAFYRNAQDASGRLTYWLDGRLLVDIADQPMAATPWVGWEASSVANSLTPPTAVLYVDDAAISRTRVGPTGVIAR